MRRERFEQKDVEADVEVHAFSPSHVLDRTRIGAKRVRAPVGDHEQVISWMGSRRDRLRDLLGLDVIPEAKWGEAVWSAKDRFGMISKRLVEFSGKIAPVYIGYSAHARSERCWMICLQGHGSGMHISLGVDSTQERWEIPVAGDRDIARWCMAAGFNVLCLEQLSLGERGEHALKKIHQHPCQDAAMHRLALGHTLLGERVAEVQGIVDLIRSDEPAGIRIGIIGNSMGGTVAMYSHALCKNIDFIIAAGCVSQFEDALISRSGRHCTDLYVPGLVEHFDCSDILMLAAPKLTIVVYGIGDQIFPIKGFAEAYSEAKDGFRRLEAEKYLHPVIGFGGHRHYRALTLAAIAKFPEVFGHLVTDGV